MRILIVTDAWSPQVNGVVTTLRHTVRELEQMGHEIGLVTPASFRTMPCPTYREIRLALTPGSRTAEMIDDFDPDAIHIATEGPLGMAARRHCLRTARPFTTSFHTQFPEYVHARCRLPIAFTYAWLRRFHEPSSAVMVPTDEIRNRLKRHGFAHLAHWSRGVDTELFKPVPRDPAVTARPVFLYAGRVAVEKSIERFLELDLPGTKWVVGDGPARASLKARFPAAVFHGMRHGPDLAYFYQQADAFVFPSRTDTFGLVLLEAMACGTPVAAFPVTGPDRRRAGSCRRRALGGSARRRAGGAFARSLSGAELRAPLFLDGRHEPVLRESAQTRSRAGPRARRGLVRAPRNCLRPIRQPGSAQKAIYLGEPAIADAVAFHEQLVFGVGKNDMRAIGQDSGCTTMGFRVDEVIDPRTADQDGSGNSGQQLSIFEATAQIERLAKPGEGDAVDAQLRPRGEPRRLQATASVIAGCLAALGSGSGVNRPGSGSGHDGMAEAKSDCGRGYDSSKTRRDALGVQGEHRRRQHGRVEEPGVAAHGEQRYRRTHRVADSHYRLAATGDVESEAGQIRCIPFVVARFRPIGTPPGPGRFALAAPFEAPDAQAAVGEVGDGLEILFDAFAEPADEQAVDRPRFRAQGNPPQSGAVARDEATPPQACGLEQSARQRRLLPTHAQPHGGPRDSDAPSRRRYGHSI